jgi:hypothetical protein
VAKKPKPIGGSKGSQKPSSMTKGAKGTGSKASGKSIPKGGKSNSGSNCPIY